MELSGAGVAGSIAKLRSAVAKGSGSSFIKNIQADSDLSVQFLTEPEIWFAYREHYDPGAKKFYPCTTDGCPGCADGGTPSKKWIAPVLDVDNSDEVIILKLAKSLVDIMLNKFEKFGTVTDRIYSLDRIGSGKDDTKYDATPMDKRRINPAKFKFPDAKGLKKIILDQVETDDGDDDLVDDVEETSTPVRRRRATSTRHRRAAPPPEDDEDDDEEPAPRRRPLKAPGQARREKEQALAREAAERRSTANTAARKPVRKSAPTPARRPIRRAR